MVIRMRRRNGWPMTTSLQIRNTVHDYDSWRSAFDKFERFRADHGVRSYRVLRRADDARDVQVILDFDNREAADEFRGQLEQIWRTPQSRALLTGHDEPVLLEDVGRQSW
jgi:hypothetical protein